MPINEKLKLFLRILPLILVSCLVITNVAGSSSKGGFNFSFNYAESTKYLNMTTIMEHINFLSSLGSRVTLYPGYERAAEYIYNKFVEYGLSNVSYHFYNITVPIAHGAYMEVLSPEFKNITLYPLWPNMVSPVQTPPGGITGRLIYVGQGHLQDFDGKPVKDSVVLMDFNSEMNWINAAKLGAKAVIFVEPKETINVEAATKILGNLPLNFPRLYIKDADASYILNFLKAGDEISVRLVSNMRFEKRLAKNVIGYVEGTIYKDLFVVFSSYYDSFSYVPELSPGASEAAGISALLEMAKYYAEHPAKYTLLFIAFSGLNEGICGARWWVKHNVDQKPEYGTKIVLMLDMNIAPGGTTLIPTWSGHFYGLSEGNAPWSSGIANYLIKNIFPSVQQQLGQYDFCIMGLGQSYATQPHYMYEEGDFYAPLNSEALMNIGGPGIGWLSGPSWRRYWGTPLDTPDRVDYKNLEKQLKYLWAVWYALANTENLRPQIIPEWKPTYVRDIGPKWADIIGKVVEYDYTKAWYRPVPNALLLIRSTGSYTNPVWPFLRDWGLWIYDIVEEDGSFLFPGATDEYRGAGFWYLLGYKLNVTTGEIIYAPDLGKYKFMSEPWTIIRAHHPWDVGFVTIMKCNTITVFDTLDPYYLNNAKDDTMMFYVFDFLSHAVPDSFGYDFAPYAAYGHCITNIYVTPGSTVEILMKSSYATRYPLGVLVNASQDYPTGYGYTPEKGQKTRLNILDFVRDLFWLNEARINMALKSGVKPSLLEDHEKTRDMLQEAMHALSNYQYARAYNVLSKAWSNERNVYINVRSSIEDVIYTVPFFAFVLVPFSLLIERLIFNSVGIKRLITLIICYAIPAILLWLYHPGFILSTDPATTLISFVILILISPILLIVINQVKESITYFRKKTMGVHEAGVSKGESLFQSISFSVNVMRARRFRTSLLLLSVILVIASLVSLTSLSAISAVTEQKATGKAVYDGIQVRHEEWAHINLDRVNTFEKCAYGRRASYPGLGTNLLDVLQDEYGLSASIVPRAWRCCVFYPAASFELSNPKTNKSANVFAILGLSPKETEVTSVEGTLIDGRWFIGSDEDLERSEFPCILSNRTASMLQVHVGDTINIWDINMILVGIVKDDAFNNITDLDGERITPLNRQLPVWNAHYPVELVLILPYRVSLGLGGWVMSASIVFKDSNVILSEAQNLFKRTGITINAGKDGKLYVYSQMNIVTLMGWQFQVIPLVIASLTLFNIMFASVYERTREINILSTVGLNPFNIALIFLSESLSLSLVGGVIGYLFAMITCSILTSIGVLPFSLNYSSMWVVIAVGVAMLTVMGSAFYPSFKASRLITPSLLRKWEITRPMGDRWEIPLPFTAMDEREATGIMKYLKEMVDSHKSQEADLFYLRTPSTITEKKEKDLLIKTLSFEASLAPYETGIRQGVEIIATGKTEQGKFTFRILCNRLTGSYSAWETLNRGFIDSLRKQFLLWRSLPLRERGKYTEK